MRNSKGSRFSILTLTLTLACAPALAHKGEKHVKTTKPPSAESKPQNQEIENKKIFERINHAYLADVKPLFQKSCLDCHGGTPDLPWYASIPGAKHLIAYDLAESKEHLDLSGDFPFVSHSTPREDLEAIAESLRENSMPPLRYKVLHWNSLLAEEEKKVIQKWIDESLVLLESVSKQTP